LDGYRRTVEHVEVAVDAMGSGGDTLECRFLRDSLEEGWVMSDGKWMNMAHLQMIYQLKMVN